MSVAAPSGASAAFASLGNEGGAGREELGQRDRLRAGPRRVASQRLARGKVGRDIRERYLELNSRDPHAVIVACPNHPRAHPQAQTRWTAIRREPAR